MSALALGAAMLAGLALAAVLTGCESTAERSAQLAAQAKAVTTESGLRIEEQSSSVRVVDKQTITDDNGSAVVVTLRSSASKALVAVPIAIDVRDAAGASVFRNDTPGAEPALVAVPAIPAGRDVVWIHDQVLVAGAAPDSVAVRVGEAPKPAPKRLPRLTVGAVRLTADPVSGTEGAGRVTNHSTVDQRRLTIYAVARRGSKLVAAGRAVVNRVAAGRSAAFSIFFIGDPAGARLTVTAPPSVLG